MIRVRVAALGAVVIAVAFACATYHQGSAESALGEGRLDDAAAEVQTALASEPDNLQLKQLAAKIFTQRGVKYYKNGEMIAASDDFHRAIDYDPFYASAYDYLGLIAFSQHDWEHAISYGQRSAGLSGQPVPGYVEQAQQQLLKVRSGGLPPKHRARSTSGNQRATGGGS
jgi:tetratricopeptide (TPR) repeat protein